ncbi:MAG TPA: PadR family transcriptional regulator [Candidatus Cloacimonetes bacterium]|nr:PadR family transcriptional regulator [Candidatus Cloacimonadota bacterium]
MISSIELTVLGLINFKSMHGYKICNFFEEKGIYDMMEIKKPSVYAILKRFEKQGLISGEYEFDENNPPRKVYSLTDEGLRFFRKHLKEFLLNYSSLNPSEFWHLLRFCRNNVTQEDFLKILHNMKETFVSHIALLKEKKRELIKEFTEPEKCYFSIMENMFETLHTATNKALNDFISFAEEKENSAYFLENEE